MIKKPTKTHILFISIILISIFNLSISLQFKHNKMKDLDLEGIPQKKEIRNLRSEDKTLKSIQVSKLPKKVMYKEGESFDKKGMVVKAIYDDKSEDEISGYTIDKNQSLTIYDSIVTVTYKGKTTTFNIKIVNEDGLEIFPNPSKEKYTLELKEGITRFEVEDSDLSKWIVSKEGESLDKKIIKRSDASNKAYVSGIDEKKERQLSFTLDLKFNSKIVMSVSYSQNEKWKKYDTEISRVYIFRVDENKSIPIDGDNILASRKDITKWQLIKYKEFSLSKGKHILSIKRGSKKTDYGSPNIDYIDFKTQEIEEAPVERDIKIPANDFHTYLQYLYITDDPETVEYYVGGIEDFSRPKGNLLDFSDSIHEDSDTYAIQVSSSPYFNTSDTKIIENLNKTQYIIKNLKLEQKIFYRGGINKNDAKSSKVYYELTVNSLPPRNIDIPGIDNTRDIGGVKTSLVKNGIVKQGLYFRSAKLDPIQKEGKKVMTEDLGIKIEIDLRGESENKGPYVDGVEYRPISIPSDSELSKFDDFKKEYYKVFDLISNADKKPVILHCSAGADRTGLMTFALMSLLGCEYNDMVRDYLFINFGAEGSRDISDFAKWWKKLNRLEGETTAEKAKNWLLSKGIEEEKLEHIREIFIENYKSKFS